MVTKSLRSHLCPTRQQRASLVLSQVEVGVQEADGGSRAQAVRTRGPVQLAPPALRPVLVAFAAACIWALPKGAFTIPSQQPSLSRGLRGARGAPGSLAGSHFQQLERGQESLREAQQFKNGEQEGQEPLGASESLANVGGTTADMSRRNLWDMPKEVLPLMKSARAFVKRREDRSRFYKDLVVMKARNSKAMMQKAISVLSSAQPTKHTLFKQSIAHRENFARDWLSQQNRPGQRAFKYRSGRPDLRNEDRKVKDQDRREPDYRRRRIRFKDTIKRVAVWVGGRAKKKYKKKYTEDKRKFPDQWKRTW